MFIVPLSPANYFTQFFFLEYGDSVPLRLSWLSTSATLWMEIKDITNENTNRNILKYCRFLVLLPPQIAVLEQLVVTMIEKASNWNQILKQSWFSKKKHFSTSSIVYLEWAWVTQKGRSSLSWNEMSLNSEQHIFTNKRLSDCYRWIRLVPNLVEQDWDSDSVMNPESSPSHPLLLSLNVSDAFS